MSNIGQTLVPGHTLIAEGLPFGLDICSACLTEHGVPARTRFGHGRCSCGAMSPCLDSANARKRWHREHKLASRTAQGEVRDV